jgi:lysine decarboxylase
LLGRDGEALLGAALDATRAARQRLADVDGVRLLDGDPLKLTLVLNATGADGVAVEQDLLAAGISLEAAERDLLVAVVTLSDDEASLTALTDNLVASIERRRGDPRPVAGNGVYGLDPVVALPPREAYFAAAEAVPVDRAAGRVCAELVAPYPPGIPVLAPGEEVTRDVLAALAEARAAGVRIAYAADPRLDTLRVIRTDAPRRG